MKTAPHYPTDLTDHQWQLLAPFVDIHAAYGRRRTANLRRVLEAILYQNRTGCQWRMLPHDFPPKSTVNYYYQKWMTNGTWEAILAVLRDGERRHHGREPTPSVAHIDSPSVKASPGSGQRGDDGAKRLTGRKRHILVESLGLLLAVVVTAASVDDAAAAPAVFARVPPEEFPRLATVTSDGKYHNHKLYAWMAQEGIQLRLEPVHRPPGTQGWTLLPKRWVVERTFAWIMYNRRLHKDNEKKVESSAARVQIAMIHLLLRRQARRRGELQEASFRYQKVA